MDKADSSSIHVMHIIARMNVGGPAVEISELMRGLDASIIRQTLVTGFCGSDEADFIETQAPDIDANRIQGFGRRISLKGDINAFLKLIALIREQRPDIIHTHTAKAGLLGRLAAKLSGTQPRVIHTYHGHLLRGYFGPIKTRIFIRIERVLARQTDTLIAVGYRVRDELLAAGIGRPGQYRVIYSGVRLGRIPDKVISRKELGLPLDKIIVSMIGRLTEIKRPDRFADVVEIVQQECSEIHFLVAGGGDCEPYLRWRIETGRLPVTLLAWQTDISRLLGATDIAIITSDNEGAPLFLIEAALAGLPAVATNVGAVREIVIDGVTGSLTILDARSLAKALLALTANKTRLRLMGQAAKTHAKAKFSLSTFIEDHQRIYK